MDNQVCHQGFIPVRKGPSHETAMVTQLLFGETFRITEKWEGWSLVLLPADGSVGWIETRSLPAGALGTAEQSAGRPALVTDPVVTVRDPDRDLPVFLPAGAVWADAEKDRISLGGRTFERSSGDGFTTPRSSVDPGTVGRRLLSLPALPGGRCGFGFDGAGLVQFLCRLRGTSVPRGVEGQSAVGSPVHLVADALPGDLAFFGDAEGLPVHAGMVVGDGRILHAGDCVRIDPFDQQGIYSRDLGDYTHVLRIIKRIGA